MKHLMIWLIVMLVLVLSFNVLAVSENECVAGGGEWTTPTIAQGDDPDSNKKTLPPLCKCDIGFYWNEESKSCESDQELRCEQTGGTWVNNECQCPEGTVKWTEGFGCDMPGSEPEALEEENTAYGVLLSIAMIVIGIIIYYYFKKKKRRRKKT